VIACRLMQRIDATTDQPDLPSIGQKYPRCGATYTTASPGDKYRWHIGCLPACVTPGRLAIWYTKCKLKLMPYNCTAKILAKNMNFFGDN